MKTTFLPAAVGVVCGVIALLPAANAVSTVIDTDSWWHLATGRLIADTGDVPRAEPFTRMGRESPRPWRAYSWAYEVGLYQVYRVGGLEGVRWSRAILCAMSAAALAAFAVRRSPGSLAELAFAGLVTVPLLPLCTERPWHLTILLCTITTWAVTSARESGNVRRLLWLPLVFVLWANLHIQFVLGWGVLGLACLFPGRANRWAFAALTAGCVVAVLANPYGPDLFRVIWEYTAESKALAHIDEMQTPEPFAVWTLVTVGLWLFAFVGVVRRRPVDWFFVLLLGVAAFLAYSKQRDLWFAVLAAIAAYRPTGESEPRVCWGVPLAVAGAFIVARLAASVGGFGNVDEPNKFPTAAVEHLNANRYPGPIYNDFDWGGYLIWAAPQYPVSLDGRTNVHGDDRLFTAFRVWDKPYRWQDDPDFAVARVVLCPAGSGLTPILDGLPDVWDAVYRDKVAVVYVRR